MTIRPIFQYNYYSWHISQSVKLHTNRLKSISNIYSISLNIFYIETLLLITKVTNICVYISDWEENICSATIKEKSEENTEHGVIVLAMLPAMQQVSELYHNGCLEFETLGKATDTLVEVNKTIVPIVQQSLVKEVTKLLEDKAKLEVK